MVAPQGARQRSSAKKQPSKAKLILGFVLVMTPSVIVYLSSRNVIGETSLYIPLENPFPSLSTETNQRVGGTKPTTEQGIVAFGGISFVFSEFR